MSNLTRRQVLKLLATGTAGAVLGSTIGCAPGGLVLPPITPVPATGATSAPAAAFDWKRFKGETLFASFSKSPVQDSLVPYLAEFEELTGIKISTEVVPEQQLRQKIPIQMAAQESTFDVWDTPLILEKRKFGKAGWYEPLNAYLKDPSLVDPDYDINDIGAAAWKLATQADGTISGFTFQLPSLLHCYRKDLLEAKGLSIPKTLDELAGVAEALHDPPNVYGFVNRGLKNAQVPNWGCFLYAMGGTWLDENRKLNLTSPEAVKSLEFYTGLLRKYGPPGVTGFNWPECQAIMLQGQGAMWTDGANLFSAMEDPTKSKVVGKMAYGLVPPGPGGKEVALLGGTGIAINPFGKKKQAAFLFCQWSTNKKNQLRMLVEGGNPVGRESAWRSPEFQAKNRMPKEWVDSALKAIQTFVPLVPDIIPIAEFRDIFGVAVTKAIEGADAATVLKEAQDEFEPIYAKSEQS